MSFLALPVPALSAIGQITQGESQGRAFNQQADFQRANAHNTRVAAGFNEDSQRRGQALELGNIRASAAQSGFDASTGSLAALQTKSAGEMELDALTTRYKGELQAVGMENDALSLNYQAKSARRGGYMSAFSTLASAAASVYGSPQIGALAPVETRIPVPTGRG